MKAFTALLFVLMAFPAFATSYTKVALVSVSSAYDERVIPYVMSAFEKKGYTVTDQYLKQSVSDLGYVDVAAARAKNLTNALMDDSVDIVWFVKGGGGSVNMLPLLEKKLHDLSTAKPKVLVGFSDVTAVHEFVNKFLGWRTVHGVVAAFNTDVYAAEKQDGKETYEISSLESLPSIDDLMGNGVSYDTLVPLNQRESVSGNVIGGNMTLVKSTLSTRFQNDMSKKILLLEDVGEAYRSLDRSLHHLLLSGLVDDVSAIIFGQFYPVDATDGERLVYKKVLTNFAKKFNKPVYYFPDFGHGHKNKPFILNGQASITCSKANLYCAIKNM